MILKSTLIIIITWKCIHKIDKVDPDELDTYKFQFKFMDEIETFESDTLKNVHFFIGDNIAKILDKKLKNK